MKRLDGSDITMHIDGKPFPVKSISYGESYSAVRPPPQSTTRGTYECEISCVGTLFERFREVAQARGVSLGGIAAAGLKV